MSSPHYGGMNKTIYSRQGDILRRKLVEIRKAAGLTQRELAQTLNKPHTFISKCELGERRVDLVEFYWICKACGVSMADQADTLDAQFKKTR